MEEMRELATGTAKIEFSDDDGSPVWMVWTGAWSAEATALWHELGRPGVGVGYPPGGDLDFLDDLDGLRALHAVGTFDDDSAVERAVTLRRLMLRTNVESRRRRLDLTALTELDDLEVEDNLVEGGLGGLPVSRLHYAGWAWPSLAPIAGCSRLTELVIESPAGLRSLSFGEPVRPDSLPPLERLEVRYCRRTLDLTPLPQLAESLREVELIATKVEDYSPLGRLPRLESLVLEGGKVADLEFLRGHPTLRLVVLHGSAVVLSGDLSPLDDMPVAEARYVRPRAGYNRRYDVLPVADD